MDPRLKRALLRQLDEQIRFFGLAIEDIAAGDSIRQRGDHESEDRLWYGVQNAVMAVGNVSKILWGQGGKLEQERAHLREFLKIPDDSPLRPTSMRNHLEHMDERIDRWFGSGGAFMSDRTIAGVPAYRTDSSQFRWFEHTRLVVAFHGDEWDFRQIAPELHRIKNVIDQYPLSGWLPTE